jgi:hypothetical protein
MKMKRYLVPVLGVLMLLFYAQYSNASVVYTFGNEYSESGAVLTGDVTVTLESLGGGDVSVTVDATDLTGTEFITGLYLNFNPLYDVGGLSTPEDETDPTATMSVGTDAFRAGSDGLYDVLFDWGVEHPRFHAGTIEYFVVSHASESITAEDFNFLSADAGGNGPFYAVLRAQGFGTNDNSGWFYPKDTPVPEPGPLALMMLGMTGLLASRKYA